MKKYIRSFSVIFLGSSKFDKGEGCTMRRTNRSRKSIMLGFLAVLMLLVTACGSNSASNANNTSGSGTEPTITLTMMHPWTTPNVDNEVYKERIAEFEKQHPNIIIKQDSVTRCKVRII
ncbi:hypothetical protein ACTNDP_06920 [Paenibacillus barengoltzii]|jgi:raffinose/stachyose/melibiose transport system substrate-binding protein|uniref:hypothetical protein n=1 Tax=Paenibacillus barengoltzii TaxID=343517 RepID=UPI003F8A4253